MVLEPQNRLDRQLEPYTGSLPPALTWRLQSPAGRREEGGRGSGSGEVHCGATRDPGGIGTRYF